MKIPMRRTRQHTCSMKTKRSHVNALKQMLALLLILGISVTSLPETAYAALPADNDPVVGASEGITQNADVMPAQEDTVPDPADTGPEEGSAASIGSDEEPYIISELTEKRDERTKYFAMSDGTIKACIYPQNVHYLKDDRYEEINNSLVEETIDGTGYYKNTENSFTVKIPQSGTDDYIHFSDENGYVRFRLLDPTRISVKKQDPEQTVREEDDTVAENISSRVVFRSVTSNKTIEYDISGNVLKETIVLYYKTNSTFVFDIQTTAERVIKNNDGSISFFDAEGTEIYTMNSPYMTDAAGEYSNAIGILLIPYGSGYRLTYTPDYQWLSAKERKYPVRIDPTLVQAIYNNTVTDTYVSSAQNAANTDIRGGWDVLNIGRRTSTVDGAQIRKRGFIRFELPGEIGKNDCIVDARLDLVHYTVSSAVSVNGIQIDVHELTSGFTEGGTWWGNQPSHDPVITDYAIVNTGNKFSGSTLSYDSYNITRLVNRWHNGGSNYGIMLKLHDEGTAVSSSKQVYYFARQSVYYGSVSKFVEITYRNTIGLEDYWSYTVHDAGERGSAYVNNFNGNLTYIHKDAAFHSGITGFTLAHVYNSTEAATPGSYENTLIRHGNGWRLNLGQRLFTASVSGNSRARYLYYDEDRTRHYFVQLDDGRIVDEDGLGYTLTELTDEYIDANQTQLKHQIKTKDNILLKFDVWGYLRRIIDSNGNWIALHYTYTSIDNYLSGITTSSGGNYQLTYDSSRYLTAVTDNAGRTTTYHYDNGFLVRICYPDGTATHFTYDAGNSNAMTVLQYSADRQNNYSYDGNSRISSVHLKGSSGAAGASYSFSYDHNQTKVTDHRNRSITYQFDTLGRPTCVYDSEGSAVSQSYTSSSAASSEIFKNNKVSLSSGNVRYINNLLYDGIFQEGLANWTVYRYGSPNTPAVVTDRNLLTSKSIRLSSDSKNGTSTIYQNVDCPGGCTYTATAYIRMEDIRSEVAGVAFEIYTTNDRHLRNSFLTGSTDSGTDNGFQKLAYTFTLEEGEKIVRISIGLFESTGVLYVDSIQLEVGDTSNAVNLISNSSFEKNTGTNTMPAGFWGTVSSIGNGGASPEAEMSGSYSFRVIGDGPSQRSFSQTVHISGKAGDVYSFGGWAKASATRNRVPDEGDGGFKMCAHIYNADGTEEWMNRKLNEHAADWQFATMTFTAPKDYTAIELYCVYNYNCNIAYFDDIFLYRDTAQSYIYDSNGNVISTKDNASQQSTFEYDGNNNLKKLLEPTGVSYEYTYDSRNNLTRAESGNGVKYNITYDPCGNPLSTVTSSTAAAGTDGTITASATYQDNGNYPHTVTDSRGNTTSYTYDLARGLQTGVTDARGSTTGYTYDADNDRLKSVTSGSSSVAYRYEASGGLDRITAPSGTTYNFTYDAFRNIKTVSVGNQKLTENFYNANNGPLACSVYGNGTKIGYTYDTLDRVTEKLYNDAVRARFKYNKTGYLYEKQDLSTNTTFRYDYDLSGRLLGVAASNGTAFRYTYDTFNRVSKLITDNGAAVNHTEYIYGSAAVSGQKTGLIYGVKQNGTQKLGYAYDSLSRLKSRTLYTGTPFVTEYGYLEGAAAGTTTTLVKTVKNGDDILEYAYDSNNNITSIKKNGVLYESYTYDSLNQLKTVARGEDTWEYTYDNGGNLLSVKENGEVIKTYGYGDTSWRDKLTSYNGQTVTYDAIGNPLAYRDGMSFTWQNGRQLAGAGIAHSDGTTDSISYSYNADGLRTTKTVNGTTTEYYWLEGVLLGQKTGEEYIFFLYDENGRAYGFLLKNGTAEATYYYEFNLQGDVTGIIDAAGSKVAEYAYDAWGEILSVTGTSADTVGQKNPLRYRGYYYDAETGFYYLTSRYYDPEVGRFINADSQLNQKDGILGYNMFAYCHNNPIMYSDPTGHSITLACIIIGAVIGAVAGGCAGAYVSKKQTGKVNGWAVAAGAVGGGVVGGLIGWGVGAAITAVGAAATSSAATAAAPVVQQVAEKASTALQTYYPPNDGFSGAVQKITLEAGTLIQRTGDLVGRYIAPAGTPTQMLSLPYDKIGQPTTILQVQQSVEVLAGRVAPWFGQIGGGIQYQLGTPLDQLISEGIIKIFGG